MNMNYLQFREAFYNLGIFSTIQVKLMYPGFNSDNLIHWQKKGYIYRIRNKWYCFSDFTRVNGFQYLLANFIYKPSYISHQEALMFYGLIPEHIVDSVSVTTRKTIQFTFQNRTYKYYSIAPALYFGYELKEIPVNGTSYNHLIADKEKAILDFLYFSGNYYSEEELAEIRFNELVLKDEVDWEKMKNYLSIFRNKALNRNIEIIRKMYEL